jgi:predicted GTPase
LLSYIFFSFCIQLLFIIDESAAQENSCSDGTSSPEVDESKLPLQLAIVGRPNVGKSTLVNTLLQEERVLVGPEAGLTRDAIRTQFEFQGRTIYLVSFGFGLLVVLLELETDRISRNTFFRTNT